MAKGKGEIKGWITRNGVHIPIYGHYSVRGGEEPQSRGARWKKKKRFDEVTKSASERENDARRKSAAEDTRARADHLKNIKSGEFTVEDVRNLNYTQWNKLGMSDLKAISKEIGLDKEMQDKDMPEVLNFWNKSDYQRNIDRRLKEMDEARRHEDSESDASKGKKEVFKKATKEVESTPEGQKRKETVGAIHEKDEKLAKGMKEVDKDDSSNKEKPKNFKEGLKQHEGIQKIANDQNEKVWNGGASNQELYDAADKFAEGKNFNKDKVRDAAFSAFNDKWIATQKERAAQTAQESSKATPESYAQSKGKSIRDIAQEVNNNDAARATANQLMKDGRTYEEAAALAHSDMERGTLKGQESSASDLHSRIQAQSEQADVHRQRTSVEKAPVPESYAERKKYKSDGLMQAYKSAKEMTGRSDLEIHQLAQDGLEDHYSFRDKEGNEIGRFSNPHTSRAGYMTLNTSATGDRSKPVARKVSGNLIPTEQPTALTAREKNLQKIKENAPVIKGTRKAGIPNTVSGLRSAYANATGSEKAKISAELRRKGYTLVGGKWVKGSKS